MNNIKSTTDEIVGRKVGSVSIHMYKVEETDSPIFYIKSTNEDMLPLSEIIEDLLKLY